MAGLKTRVSTGRDVPLSICPGTKRFSCPVVPLSRDKGKSKCPGTSRDKFTFPKEHIKQKKDVPKQENDQISCFRTTFSVLEHHFPVLEHPFLLSHVLCRVPSRILAVPACPVPNFGCPGPSRPLARFLACSVVPLSR